MTADPGAVDPDTDDDDDSGERMLLLLLESTDPAVVDLGRRVLEGLGFQVDVGTPTGSDPGLVFDYKTARFAVIAVGDGASARDGIDGGASGTGTSPPESPYQLFAAILSGQERHEGIEGLTWIEPAVDGAWTERLVETIRLLGWLT